MEMLYILTWYESFNPRPPFRAGATGEQVAPGRPLIGFNPRPPFRAGATGTTTALPSTMSLFQSSPALSSGRYGG